MIPHVNRGTLVNADQQNAMIDTINEHSDDIESLKAASGDPDAVQGLIDESLYQHTISQTPHPVYDDIQSLVGLFENGLI